MSILNSLNSLHVEFDDVSAVVSYGCCRSESDKLNFIYKRKILIEDFLPYMKSVGLIQDYKYTPDDKVTPIKVRDYLNKGDKGHLDYMTYETWSRLSWLHPSLLLAKAVAIYHLSERLANTSSKIQTQIDEIRNYGN